MITHLKDRKYYEDLYDKITVDIGRREAGNLLRAREEFLSKAKITDQEELNKMDFWWEQPYWWLVELPSAAFPARRSGDSAGARTAFASASDACRAKGRAC